VVIGNENTDAPVLEVVYVNEVVAGAEGAVGESAILTLPANTSATVNVDGVTVTDAEGWGVVVIVPSVLKKVVSVSAEWSASNPTLNAWPTVDGVHDKTISRVTTDVIAWLLEVRKYETVSFEYAPVLKYLLTPTPESDTGTWVAAPPTAPCSRCTMLRTVFDVDASGMWETNDDVVTDDDR
jgi:hypothetical protein